MSDPGFLDRLTKQYFERYKSDAHLVAYVFPTHRGGYYFRDRLKKMSDGTRWFPEIFSIHDFITRLSPLVCAPSLELIFQLYSVYKEQVRSHEMKFEKFYTWGKMILSDFNEVDKQMADIDTLFRYLKEFGDVEMAQNDDQAGIYRRFVGFWGELGSLYHEFRRRLKDEGKAYEGMVYRDVAENLKNQKPQPWERVVFCALNALTESEKKIVDFFLENANGELVWDMDRYFIDDDTQEAGFFYRENLKHFGPERMDKWVGSSLPRSKEVFITSVSSDAGQAKVVGELLKKTGEKKVNSEEIAIVLPDESLLFPLLNSLPESIGKINVTLGYPLKQSSLYDLFFLILEMQKNAGSQGFFYENVFDLLRHPYFKLTMGDKGRHWIRKIRERNEIYIREIPEMDPALGKIFTLFTDSSEIIDLFLDLLYFLRDFNEKADDDSGLFPMDLEFIHHFYILMNQMKLTFNSFNVVMDVPSLWRLFSDIVSDTRIPFTGEPLEGIQVMGMLETQALSFKTVYLLSVNEGVLPVGKSSQSFIPYEIRKLMGLPTHDEKDAVSAYHFYRLIKDASNVHLIYNSRIKGIQKKEKSRYVDQLLFEFQMKNPNVRIKHRFCDFEFRSSDVPDISIDKTDETLALLEKRIFSASSLLTYLTCSLKFYLTYVLGIREMDEMIESPDDRILGNIVHRVLERCYAPFVEKIVTADQLKEMDDDSFYDPVITGVMKGELNITDVQVGRNRVVFEVIKAFMSHFFRYEKGFPGFRVKGLEKNIEGLSLEVKIPGKPIHVKLKGVVDRWDEKDGTFRIIDYKTGEVKSLNIESFDEFRGEKISSRRSSFQLMFYGFLFHKVMPEFPVSKLGIFSLRKPEMPLTFLSIGKRSDIEPGDFHEFEQFLSWVFQEIFDPKVPFSQTPYEILCRNCPFQSQCNRIQRDFD